MNKYFVYDPNDGFETYGTIEERDAAAKVSVDSYLDDGWGEEVEQVCVGIVTGRATMCDIRPKPKRADYASDDEYTDAICDWGGDTIYDSICDYKIRDLP